MLQRATTVATATATAVAVAVVISIADQCSIAAEELHSPQYTVHCHIGSLYPQIESSIDIKCTLAVSSSD